MLGLTQIWCPSVLAIIPERKERILHPISGSDVNDISFTYHDHLVSDGFAVAVSMDLPTPVTYDTKTKVGFAVGLGDSWTESTVFPQITFTEYTPYVKEMWIKVKGDYDYTVTSLGAIEDNTGTGESGIGWKVVVEFLSLLFTAFEIYLFVRDIYQEPLSEEWDRDEHWARPIVRQTGDWDSRVQTACASFMSYFNREGRNTFTITAEAQIWLFEQHTVNGSYFEWHREIGTHRVSYEVEFMVGIHELEVFAQDQHGFSLLTGDVYIDGNLSGYTWEDYDLQYGTHEIFVNDFWEKGLTGNRYTFQHWEDGSTENPRTLMIDIDKNIIAYFKKKWCPGDANGDGIVDLLDLVLLGVAYESYRGDPLWDSRVDFNRDLLVDVLDMVVIGANYGKEYPDP